MNLDLELAECAEVEAELGRLSAPGAPLEHFFDAKAPIGIARAPGRLDVMGGIADYSGSLVLELPIREAAFVAAQLHPEQGVRAISVDAEGGALRRSEVSSAALADADYAEARRLFQAKPEEAWAAYVSGTLVPLVRECGLRLGSGVRIALLSRVPEGKGLSSSAAIEVAAFHALAAAADVRVPAEQAALLCQKVENLIVGAPCGVMDQMTSVCGVKGELLELLCQPASIQGHVAVPAEIAFFGIDSGVRHAVTGADYGDVRVGAFMGYRLMAEAAGLSVEPARAPGHVRIDDTRWGGYLANVKTSELDAKFLAHLPERMRGEQFLERYGGTVDSVTRVDPEKTYPVRAAAVHPIREHHRVRLFAELLGRAASPRAREVLGELMYASHTSYSACGLGSEGTDRVVDLVRALGPSRGLYGAKITGGGSGGTVAVLARADAGSAVEAVAALYAQQTGRAARVFRGSSAGAAALGPRIRYPAALGITT